MEEGREETQGDGERNESGDGEKKERMKEETGRIERPCRPK